MDSAIRCPPHFSSPSSNNDILAYRITRRYETELLNNLIIENNLTESDRTHNTQYIMSVGTSWLRANPGSTLRDLEQKLQDLNVTTIIVATPYKESIDFDLCVPGNPDVKPKYIATFVNDIREHQTEFLKKIYSITPAENYKMLEESGFSCQKGQSYEVATAKAPDPETIKQQSNNITYQLQWAGISITVEKVNIEQILAEELRKIEEKYNREPYRYQVVLSDERCSNINGLVVDFLAMPEDGRINIVSKFGILHRNGKEIAIHIKSYIRNTLREKLQTFDAETVANDVITSALEKFDINKLVNATDQEKKSIVKYLEQQLMNEPPVPELKLKQAATANDLKQKMAEISKKKQCG